MSTAEKIRKIVLRLDPDLAPGKVVRAVRAETDPVHWALSPPRIKRIIAKWAIHCQNHRVVYLKTMMAIRS